MTEENLEELYYTMVKITAELVGKGYSAVEISAVMTRVALQIYKTTLSDIDYDKMIDTISQSRNEIQKFSLDTPLQ